jgi:PPM family protein phosphatase
MGGHAGGEIASRVTVETVPAVVQEVLSELTVRATTLDLIEALREGMQAANEAVYKQARANPELRGMGTTCVSALFLDSYAILGNVGDSRAYLLRKGALTQETHDHSLVQEHVRAGELTDDEARESRFKNVITRAIGIASAVEPDVEVLELEEGDTLLLCSDGLSGMLRDEDIAELLRAEPDAQRACDLLVEAANANGGTDNITAVVVRYGAFVPAVKPATGNGTTNATHAPPYAPAYTPAAETGRRVGLLPFLLLLTLTVVLGAALVFVGTGQYELSSGFPFIHAKRPPKPVEPPKASAPDFAKLAYDAPVVVIDKAVRGAPVASDAAGNVFVTTLQSGKIIRVSPDGSVSGDFSVVTSPAADTAARHWAADPQGNLYVSSKPDRAVYKYDARGTRIAVIGQNELTAPEGIAVDGNGNLYVVDENRLKVLKAHVPGKAEGARTREGEGATNAVTSPGPGGLSVEDRGPRIENRSGSPESPNTRTPEHRTPRRSGGRDGSR